MKLVSNEPVTGAGTEHRGRVASVVVSLGPQSARGQSARPDDTYPESRYEHVSTSTTESTESTEPTEPAGAGETGEPDETDEAGETGEADTDAEFDRLLSSVTPAPPAPTRLIYPPLKPRGAYEHGERQIGNAGAKPRDPCRDCFRVVAFLCFLCFTFYVLCFMFFVLCFMFFDFWHFFYFWCFLFFFFLFFFAGGPESRENGGLRVRFFFDLLYLKKGGYSPPVRKKADWPG